MVENPVRKDPASEQKCQNMIKPHISYPVNSSKNAEQQYAEASVCWNFPVTCDSRS